MALDVGSQMAPGDTLTSSCAERTRPWEHSWILRWGRERGTGLQRPRRVGELFSPFANGTAAWALFAEHRTIQSPVQCRPDSAFSRLFSHHLQDV